jgi:hypothetical protein
MNVNSGSNPNPNERPPLELYYGGNGFDRLWSQGTDVEELWRQVSPCGQFEMAYLVCQTQAIPWPEAGVCEITRLADNQIVARLFRDHHTPPQYVWLSRNPGPILIWASTYCYGYEVVDFGRHELHHIEENPGEDFIWTGVSLSPDQQLLAIEGCYWACPYQIRILDVRECSRGLAFPEVGLFQQMPGTLQWTSNLTLQTTNNGHQTWCGVISPAWREPKQRLTVWRTLMRGAELDKDFLSPDEFKRQMPRPSKIADDSKLVEILANSSEEALLLF